MPDTEEKSEVIVCDEDERSNHNPLINLINLEIMAASTVDGQVNIDNTMLTSKKITAILNSDYHIPIDRLQAIQEVVDFLIEQKNLMPGENSFIKLTKPLYKDCRDLFELPSLQDSKYRRTIVNRLHSVARKIIDTSLLHDRSDECQSTSTSNVFSLNLNKLLTKREKEVDQEVLEFILKEGIFIDYPTNHTQTLHWGRTDIRNHVCELFVKKTQGTRTHQENPFLPYLGDGTNGQANKKRTNKFNVHILNLILHCQNTPLQMLNYIEEAYQAVMKGDIRYSPTQVSSNYGNKELKDLQFRHFGLLQKAILKIVGRANIHSNEYGDIRNKLIRRSQETQHSATVSHDSINSVESTTQRQYCLIDLIDAPEFIRVGSSKLVSTPCRQKLTELLYQSPPRTAIFI